jgi:hypothetical protein
VPLEFTVSNEPTLAGPLTVGAPVENGATPATTEVDFEYEAADPALFVAVTRTRRNLVTSVAMAVYVEEVLFSEISVQPVGRVDAAAPEFVQRSHLYAYEAVGVAFQVPLVAVRSDPYLAVPEIDGVLLTDGICATAALAADT